MAMNDETIVLAQDATLDSLDNGDPQSHQTGALTTVQGAKGLRLLANIVSLTTNAKVKFELESSLDGKNWDNSVLPFDGRATTTLISAAGEYTHLYTGKPTEELQKPYHRFAVKIDATSAGSRGTARLTALVVAMKDAPRLSDTETIGEDQALVASQNETDIGTEFALEGFSSVELNGKLDATPAAAVTIALQTTTRRQTSTMWTTVATKVVSDDQPFVLQATELSTYGRVVYSSGAGAVANLDLDMTRRTF